nr:hypothetical protein [Tanacetum cinerariifolium]
MLACSHYQNVSKQTTRETVTAASAIIPATEPQVPAATIIVAPARVIAAPSRRRKGVAIDHVKLKAKEDPSVKRYQAMKRKPQTRAQTQKNMMMYLKNVAEKAAKRRRLNEEVEDLKRHLEIVPNEDDDVYTEAIPLARKSLVNERFSTAKPKTFSNDFLLTTLGAMFETPEPHAQIWKNQRSVYGQAKVKSWKLLESYGVQIITFTTTQLILLVEMRYPLSRFTLDQMLNAVRLQVEEESEVSLELLRFTRQ